jgi:hypothetical protein
VVSDILLDLVEVSRIVDSWLYFLTLFEVFFKDDIDSLGVAGITLLLEGTELGVFSLMRRFFFNSLFRFLEAGQGV